MATDTWRGAKRRIGDPAIWTTDKPFNFGNREVPAGVEVRQFETTNFGWTSWRDPQTNQLHIAKE